MSELYDRMKKITQGLSPEVKKLVSRVIHVEHDLRFKSRKDVPEELANFALREAKEVEETEQ